MKFAIPTAMGKLTVHFGHCREFCIVNVEDNEIKGTEVLEPPAHEPGVLPQWLKEHEVNVVITGGMGQMAKQLFAQAGVEVVTGAPAEEPEKIVADYLSTTLVTGENACGHDPNSPCQH
ncbi:MAG: NifB/NifX family molybdenum-iron cluster-binding protein [Thermodesulfobacteriota bacterium]|nr:NifB/NifX family molybdenum-iron cluster-binding protein [Thermodesulfobacteriota bacterium]